MVNSVSVNRFDKTWSQRTHDWGVEKRVNARRLCIVVLTIGTFGMRGTREREGTAQHSYYGCWSIEASTEVAGNRLRVERGRTQLTVRVVSTLCVTIDVINYRWSAGFHRNRWILEPVVDHRCFVWNIDFHRWLLTWMMLHYSSTFSRGFIGDFFLLGHDGISWPTLKNAIRLTRRCIRLSFSLDAS